MEKLNELVEQAKEMAVLHGPVWSSALCESGCDGQAIKHHAIISDSKNDFVIDTGSNTNEASWLCDYLELCSPANILAIAEAFRAMNQQRDALAAENAALKTFINQSCYSYDGDGSDVCDSYVGADESPFFPKTPATDSCLNSLRAKGVEMLLASLPPHYTARSDIEKFAAQLRAGKDGE